MKKTKSRLKNALYSAAFLIFLNLLLGALKLVAGISYKSLAVTADAANNLSDALGNILIIISFVLSSKAADKQHPHGHGRYEYISALILGLFVTLVGAEFLKTSIKSAINPTQSKFGLFPILIMCLSVMIKLIMALYAHTKAKKLNSQLFKAVRADSITDMAVTFSVLISLVLKTQIKSVYIDSVVSAAVSLFIIYVGLKMLLQTVGKLLGERADSDIFKELWEYIKTFEGVDGVHDLSIHDYGAKSIIATAHIEADASISLKSASEIASGIERGAKEKFGIELLIRLDPVKKACKNSKKILEVIDLCLATYSGASIHDFHLEETKVEFDISLPERYENQKKEIDFELQYTLKKQGLKQIIINFDIIY